MDDATLLQKFVSDRCDNAFAELVRRYVDLVWSAARRQTNNADLAEEVVQAVFITFAQKAGTIRAGEAIGGWLLVTTRYTALNAVRAKARRSHHERKAAAMKREEKSDAAPDWESISPLLDEAVARLKREDRDALALRFFQGRSMADVGAALGISSEAAQKRVTRAVAKLRDIFAARGLATTEDALGSLLAVHAIHAAPAVLQSAIAAQTLAHSGVATTSSLATSKGLIALMATANAKILAVSSAAIVLLGITGTVAYQSFAAPGGKGRQIKVDPAAQIAQSPGAPGGRPPLSPARPESQWLPRFTEVYALQPSQNVKFIPRPFISERTDFYRAGGESQYQALPSGPDIMLVEYDGTKFSEQGETFGGTPDVTSAVHYALRIEAWDLRGPGSLLNFKMPGDWVVRKGLKTEQLLPGFLTEVSKAYHRNVTLEMKQIPRQAVIVRGTLDLHPLAPADNNREKPVYFYRGQLNPAKASYCGGNITERISELCDMPVVDEAHVPADPNIAVHIASNMWYTNKESNPKHQQLTEELLANLAKQTSLDFKIETRVLPLWTIAAD